MPKRANAFTKKAKAYAQKGKPIPDINIPVINTNINTDKPKKTKVFSADSFEYSLAYKFLEAHKKNQTPGVLYKLKEKSEEEVLQSFAGGLDNLKRLDKYKDNEVKFILDYLIKDNKIDKPGKKFYWLDQIQTTDKLRDKNREKVPYFVVLIEPAKKEFITNQAQEV